MRIWLEHSFEKIDMLGDYLGRFTKAARGAPNRVYIDAFAGETENELRGTGQRFAGSAQIALGVDDPPFTHVALFETNPARLASLWELAEPHGDRVRIFDGDCNDRMAEALDWVPQQAPTFAFLDPCGMEVDWSTVRLLAEHKRGTGRTKVEMLILFTTMGLPRVLGAGLDHTVARLYGARGPWERIRDARQADELSGGEAKQAYLELYLDRLEDLGYKHLAARPIHAAGHGEVYSLVFVTDHDAGKEIFGWAAERPRTIPRDGQLFAVPEVRPPLRDTHSGWRDRLPLLLPPWVEE